MRLGTAIELLIDNYRYASDKEWIQDKVAWALYHTWKEADRKTENSSEKPNNCDTCKWGEWYRKGYDITMMDDECGGCCSWNSKWTPKDEPSVSEMPTGSESHRERRSDEQ